MGFVILRTTVKTWGKISMFLRNGHAFQMPYYIICFEYDYERFLYGLMGQT